LHVIADAAALAGDDRDNALGDVRPLEAASARLRRGDRAFLHHLLSRLATLENDLSVAGREAKTALSTFPMNTSHDANPQDDEVSR